MRVRRIAAIDADPLLTFGVLAVLLIVVAAGYVGPLTAESPDFDLDVGPLLPTTEPTPTQTGSGPDGDRGLSEAAGQNLPFALFTILLFISIFLFTRFLLSLRRERLPHSDQQHYPDGFSARDNREEDRRAAVAGLKQAEAALSGPGNSRDAVISCWLFLERATTAAGVSRNRPETTSEYTARVLALFRAPAADLAFLQRTYQRARFGGGADTQIPLPDLDRARTSLRNIIAAVEGSLPPEQRTGS